MQRPPPPATPPPRGRPAGGLAMPVPPPQSRQQSAMSANHHNGPRPALPPPSIAHTQIPRPVMGTAPGTAPRPAGCNVGIAQHGSVASVCQHPSGMSAQCSAPLPPPGHPQPAMQPSSTLNQSMPLAGRPPPPAAGMGAQHAASHRGAGAPPRMGPPPGAPPPGAPPRGLPPPGAPSLPFSPARAGPPRGAFPPGGSATGAVFDTQNAGQAVCQGQTPAGGMAHMPPPALPRGMPGAPPSAMPTRAVPPITGAVAQLGQVPPQMAPGAVARGHISSCPRGALPQASTATPPYQTRTLPPPSAAPRPPGAGTAMPPPNASVGGPPTHPPPTCTPPAAAAHPSQTAPMPLSGLHVDGRSKAGVQRRQYAQGEVLGLDAPDRNNLHHGSQEDSQQTNPGQASAAGNNRIDPSQIPRPDASRRTETWSTQANLGQCPPPATSAYVVNDDGNCSPRYMRLTLNQVITSGDLLTASAMPLAVIAQPLAEVPACDGAVPVVDFGEAGPVRCERCRAYVNPFFTFSDGGRSFTCNLCGAVNQTPRDYYCEIDYNGYRRDHNDRPELCRGVCDFAAPTEYQARPPRPPPIVILLEASYASITDGVFHAVLSSLSAILPLMPPFTQIALVVFDEGVHFFRIDTEGSIRHMVVPDNTEPCLPLPPNELFMTLGDDLHRLEQLLKAAPGMVAQSPKADTSLGSALEVGTQLACHRRHKHERMSLPLSAVAVCVLLKVCHLLLEGTGGRLLMFQHVLPALGPLKLQQRDDVRVYGTDKERSLLAPADASWEELAKKMAAAHICVSSFHFASQIFIDVATCGFLARRTNGQSYLYQNCVAGQHDIWATKLHMELDRNLRRDFGYEGVMRFRCSKGLCIDQYLIGSARPGEAEVDIPGIDADQAFAVTLKHDDKLEDGERAFVQCALLYTTSDGFRRVRVMTIGLQTTVAMASLYRYADLDALLNVILRQAILLSLKQSMHQVREWVVNATVQILYTYRKRCASASTAAGQLILPESLKLLPLYSLSLTKNGVLRAGTDVRADERSALMADGLRMAVASSVAFIYPRLFPVHSLTDSVGVLESDGSPMMPNTVPLALEKLEPDGVFCMDDAIHLYIWVGRSAPPELLEALLQLSTLDEKDCALLRLPPLDNDVSRRANSLIHAVRSQRRGLYQSVRILAPKDPLETRFLSMLTEDRAQTSMSYVEFLCHIHRQIQQKFNN